MLTRMILKQIEVCFPHISAISLLGARQIGKTTLAKQLGAMQDALYLDLESPESLLQLKDPLVFFRAQESRLIILDEIQHAPELFPILRGLIDEHRQQGRKGVQYLLLGSASLDLLRQSSESLAGRIRYFYMSGLNVLELRDSSQIAVNWLRGGFPDSYLSVTDELAMDWLEDFITTYLERDIPQLGFRIPAGRLRRLWTMLAHQQGEVLNYSKLATNLEVDSKTVRYYLDILVDLLLVRRVMPWHENVKKRMVKSPRYYIRDSGVVHRLLGIDDMYTLRSHPVLGKSWEGFVVENIYSVLPRRAEAYFYRTAAGAEIDLVIKLSATEIWAVEIKYGVAPKLGKHYSRICDDVGATKKYIVYGGDDEFPVGDVVIVSLTIFLGKMVSKFFS